MNQPDGYRKGLVDLEQPPHVDGTRATYPPASPIYAPGVEVVQRIPVREPLPCCGLGFGWTLFILGFFLTISWYVGALLLIDVQRKKDYRERPGCIACFVGAVVITIAIILKVVGVIQFTSS